MKDCVKISKKPEIYLINLPQKSDEVFFDVYSPSGKLFESKKSVAHLLEHYLVGVFCQRNTDGLLRTNGFVGEELMNLRFVCHSKDFLTNLPLFLQSIFQPDFTQKSVFNSEKKAVVNEFLKESNNVIAQVLKRTKDFGVFKKCPYINKDVYDAKEIEAVQFSDIKKFLNAHYLHSKHTFFIGGNQLKKEVITQAKNIIAAYFSKWKFNDGPKNLHFDSFQINNFQRKDIRLKNIGRGTYFFLVFSGLSIKKNSVKERLTLSMFCRIIFDASNANIFKRLREEGLYSLDYENVFYDYLGFTNLACFSQQNNISKILQILKEEVEAVKNRPELINKKMVGFIRQRIINSQKSTWSDNGEKYSWIKNDLVHDNIVVDVKFYKKILTGIDQKFLSQMAKRIFNWDKCYLFIVRRGGQSKA